MTAAGVALLAGIDEDSVDFIPTYNEEDYEPQVLPAGFPNLLANGSTGIAVGMATSIPPHNAAEVCDAALHLIKTPNARIETLMQYVKGPDFPTGGIIIEPNDSMLEAYKTGKGGFKVRARWKKEKLDRGQYQIVVTEIPYQVQKSRLIEKLAELIETKKVPWLADVRDESAEDIRVVLEPKSKNIEHFTTDLSESLALDDVDAVILATPTPLHAQQAIQCLQAGKHVMVEIPMADNIADARQLVQVQKEMGLVAMAGHTRRFNPSHQWIHNKVAAGELNIQQMDIFSD